MQFDALFGRIVHAYFLFGFDNRGRFQHAFLFIGIKADFALYNQVHSGLNGRHNIFCLLFCHELSHANRVGIVCDIKRQLNPFFSGFFADNFTVVYKEHIAFDGHAVKRTQRIPNSNRFF